MKKLTVRVPEKQLDGLNALVELGHFPNQSEATRDAIRRMLTEERQRNGYKIESALRKVRSDGGER